jgi:hypothetical protein
LLAQTPNSPQLLHSQRNLSSARTARSDEQRPPSAKEASVASGSSTVKN